MMLKVWLALVLTPPLAVPPLSTAATVMAAVPLALGAAVKVRVPAAERDGAVLNRPGFVLPVMTKLTVCPAATSSGGPARMFVAQLASVWGPASSRTVGSAPRVKLGGSLTPLTLMLKVWPALVSTPPLAVPPLSFATTVIVAVPTASDARASDLVPVEEIAGAVLNRPGFVLPVTRKLTVW